MRTYQLQPEKKDWLDVAGPLGGLTVLVMAGAAAFGFLPGQEQQEVKKPAVVQKAYTPSIQTSCQGIVHANQDPILPIYDPRNALVVGDQADGSDVLPEGWEFRSKPKREPYESKDK